MRRALRAIGCLFLIFTAVLSLSACTKDKDEAEIAVENTLSDFMEAYCDLEFTQMASYTVNEDAFKKKFQGSDITELLLNKFKTEEEQAEKEPSEKTQEREELLEELAPIITAKCDYALRDIKKQGDRYICTVEVRIIDMGNVRDMLELIDERAIYNEIALEINETETSMPLAEKEKLCAERTRKRTREETVKAYKEADAKWKSVDMQFSVKNDDQWVVYDAKELADLINADIVNRVELKEFEY